MLSFPYFHMQKIIYIYQDILLNYCPSRKCGGAIVELSLPIYIMYITIEDKDFLIFLNLHMHSYLYACMLKFTIPYVHIISLKIFPQRSMQFSSFEWNVIIQKHCESEFQCLKCLCFKNAFSSLWSQKKVFLMLKEKSDEMSERYRQKIEKCAGSDKEFLDERMRYRNTLS